MLYPNAEIGRRLALERQAQLLHEARQDGLARQVAATGRSPRRRVRLPRLRLRLHPVHEAR